MIFKVQHECGSIPCLLLTSCSGVHLQPDGVTNIFLTTPMMGCPRGGALKREKRKLKEIVYRVKKKKNL